jgi:hypothetical protein
MLNEQIKKPISITTRLCVFVLLIGHMHYYKFWVLQLKFNCMQHMQLQICVIAQNKLHMTFSCMWHNATCIYGVNIHVHPYI